MTGIPLVNSNSVDDINTSIIAIKKGMKSSGETEVNVNVNLPDTAIPVDEVTSGNMHSVTSNAVYQSQKWFYKTISIGASGIYPIALPSGIQNYECLVYEAQRHITYRGIHIAGSGDVIIGCSASQYGALDNSQVTMGNNTIAFGAETVRGNVTIYYRPINLELIN